MKSFLLLLTMIVCLLPETGFSQSTGLTNEQKMILDLELKWMTAVAKKDRAVLEELLGENFELSKIGGRASTNIKRDKWIENYMNMDWSKFRFNRMQISVDSSLATVNSVLSFKLRPYPFRLSSGVLDVWRKTDGKWKVEKRYLSQDNLSTLLDITKGIALGVGLLILIRWLHALFATRRAERRDD